MGVPNARGRILLNHRYQEKARQNSELVRAAEFAVFKYLEKRWAAHIGGQSLPAAVKKRMRGDVFFQELVKRVLLGEQLTGDDLDFAPVVERQLDGTVRNRMDEELGCDPREFRCAQCSVEIPQGQKLCTECATFEATRET